MQTMPARPLEPVTRAIPSFVARLREHGDAPAVVGRVSLTYAQLADRIDAMAAELASPHRRLIVVEVANDLDSLIAYLGSLASGHVVLLASAGDAAATERLIATYSPDVRLRRDGQLTVSPSDGSHDLHAELALLLSTSGSMGSPKLVRLSTANLDANAAQIVSYLDIRPTDRAALTLPMHYCYGLSIVHSNLAAGAAVLIDDRSVVDRCFWDEFARWGGTSISGVPYTFELLDRVGFADIDLPTLRYVTQAGGRLAPETVQRYARLGGRDAWDLFVMYGQTEATARMAYLPPHLAATRPSAIGVPVPGGEFRIDDGELIYRGPNVMLGYASSPADLALGRTVDALRTGDLAVQADDGLYEIVGRASRFIKPFGLRIDLDRLEHDMAVAGVPAVCTGDDHRLVVAATSAAAHDAALATAQRFIALPASAIDVVQVPEVPRLANGKVDYQALVAAADQHTDSSFCVDLPRCGRGKSTQNEVGASVERLFAQIFVREIAPTDTFVGLGGDSLSYVEVSIALEALLGAVPLSWPTMTVGELGALHRDRSRTAPCPRGRSRVTSMRTVEMNVLLRAIAIVVIVGSHTAVMNVRGGAHVLLAVAGFNTARFHLGRAARSAVDAIRPLAAATARVALPAVAWIGGMVAFTDQYSLANVVLLNSIVGPSRWGERWQYWFIEVLLHVLVGAAVLLCVPTVRRIMATRGFELAVGLTIIGLALRYDALGIANPERLIHRVDSVVWFFTLGWAAYRATSPRHRLIVTALLAIGIPHYFESGRRESYVAIGVLALIWFARVAVPGALLPPIRVLAASSLYIYLTHWQLYPAVAAATSPLVALLASLAAGAVVWWLVETTTAFVARLDRRGLTRSALSIRRWPALDALRPAARRPRPRPEPETVR